MLRSIAAIAAASVLAMAGVGAQTAGQTWSRPADYPQASADIQAFVRDALTDRLRANDVPDMGMLHWSQPIGVRAVMPQAQLTLSESALPKVDKYEFVLLSPADAQARADRANEAFPFLVVDQPVIGATTATLWLGVDIALPRAQHAVKQCCCAGRAEFRRTSGGWTFAKWLQQVCS
jgi:hypothetical protein